jgi:hypothetical protein
MVQRCMRHLEDKAGMERCIKQQTHALGAVDAPFAIIRDVSTVSRLIIEDAVHYVHIIPAGVCRNKQGTDNDGVAHSDGPRSAFFIASAASGAARTLLCDALLLHGADPNALGGAQGGQAHQGQLSDWPARFHQTPLHAAVVRQDDDMVRYLLALAQTDPNRRDSAGVAPVTLATKLRFFDAALMLLEQGASLVAGAGEGASAGSTAAGGGAAAAAGGATGGAAGEATAGGTAAPASPSLLVLALDLEHKYSADLWHQRQALETNETR